MKKKKRIAGLGEVLWDCYPDEKYLGGAPANAAIHVQQLGSQGVVISAVGEDHLGDEIIVSLQRRNVNVSYIQKNPKKPTGMVDVAVDSNGNPHFKCSSESAFDAIQWQNYFPDFIANIDAVIFGTLAQRSEVSRNTIQRFLESASSVLKVFDVNFRVWSAAIEDVLKMSLPKTDILKINEYELIKLHQFLGQKNMPFPEFLNRLIQQYNLKMIAVSLGPEGCFLFEDGRNHHSPGYVVDVVDTTGCGDGFAAALTLAYLEGDPLDDIAEYANMIGAFVSTQKSAIPYYTAKEVERFYRLPYRRSTGKPAILFPDS